MRNTIIAAEQLRHHSALVGVLSGCRIFYQESCRMAGGIRLDGFFRLLGEPTPYFGWASEDNSRDGRRAVRTSDGRSGGFPKDLTTSIKVLVEEPMGALAAALEWERSRGRVFGHGLFQWR